MYSNITVLMIENDGIMFRYGEEYRYDRVKFTNMAESVQVKFGYDVKKMAQQEQARKEQLEQRKAQRRLEAERAENEREARRGESLREAASKIYAISSSDFPKDTNAVRVCRLAVYEVKGIQTAIEMGITYQKYSDLLTDTAISIGKIKDNNQGLFPGRFDAELERSLRYFTSARKWWKNSMDTDYTKAECDYLHQEAWKEATLSLTYCLAIAEQRTNIMDSVTGQVAELVIFKELASRKKITFSDKPDPVFEGLDKTGIEVFVRAYLKTNSPATRQF